MFYRILFESLNNPKRATGVLVNYRGNLIDVRAKKEIILSSGSVGSPHILMLSGVGPAQHLKNLDVISNLLFLQIYTSPHIFTCRNC